MCISVLTIFLLREIAVDELAKLLHNLLVLLKLFIPEKLHIPVLSPLPSRLQHLKVSSMQAEARHVNIPVKNKDKNCKHSPVSPCIGNKVTPQVVTLHEVFMVEI